MSTDWSSERDPRESFRAVLINIACEIVDPKEVQCLRFLVDADRSAEVESALEVFQLMLKKGRFSFSNVEPLKEVLENVNRYDLVSKYLENYMCRQRLWEAASNQTVGECELVIVVVVGPQRMCGLYTRGHTGRSHCTMCTPLYCLVCIANVTGKSVMVVTWK